MAYEKGSRPEGGFKKRGPARRRKKVCVFCGKENAIRTGLILKSVNTSEGLPHIVVWWFFFIYFSVDIRKQFLL